MTFENDYPAAPEEAVRPEGDDNGVIQTAERGQTVPRWSAVRDVVEKSSPKLVPAFTDDVLDRAVALISDVWLYTRRDEQDLGMDAEIADLLPNILGFLSANGVVSAASLETDAYLPHLVALFALSGGSLDNGDQTERAREWFWCAALSGAYENLDDDGHHDASAEAVTWILDEKDEPSFMQDFRLLRSALTHRQGLKLKRFGKAAVSAVVASGAVDALTGETLADTEWKTVPVFAEWECEGEGWSEDQLEGPVNRIAVSVENAKIIGTSLASYARGAGSAEEFSGALAVQGIDMDALVGGRAGEVFGARGEWIVRNVDRLVGYRLERALTLHAEQLTPDVTMFSRGAVGLGRKGANDTIVVLAGSTMSADNNPTQRPRNTSLREKLVADGVVVPGANGLWVFVSPYQFVSLSAAVSVLSGRNSSANKWLEVPTGELDARLADLEKRRSRWERKLQNADDTRADAVEDTDDEDADDDSEIDLASDLFDFDDEDDAAEDTVGEEDEEDDIAGELFKL